MKPVLLDGHGASGTRMRGVEDLRALLWSRKPILVRALAQLCCFANGNQWGLDKYDLHILHPLQAADELPGRPACTEQEWRLTLRRKQLKSLVIRRAFAATILQEKVETGVGSAARHDKQIVRRRIKPIWKVAHHVSCVPFQGRKWVWRAHGNIGPQTAHVGEDLVNLSLVTVHHLH